VINIVCDNAFMIGYGLSKTRVDEDMVRHAVKDMEAPIQRKFISTRIITAVKEIPFLAEAVNFLRRKFLSSSSY
jgi:hypothetical protein